MLILSLFILLSPIWLWLLLVLNISSSFSSITSVLDLCKRNWSPKGKLVVLAAVINSFNTIWFCRNQARFTDKRIHVRSAVNLIISITSLCGNHSKLAANSSISEFVLLKAFSIKTTYKNAPIIKEVLCHPPILNWVKCNIDGASLGNPGPSSCGDIFRNSNAEFLGPFAMNLGVSNSIYAKLHGAMIAIETSFNRGRKHLWLETDSMLVTHAFKSKLVVPWHLRNRWENCLHHASFMSFFITHMYREGNHCADKIAVIGLSLNTFFW